MQLTARVPEPELMDDPEQARAYSAADFAEAHQRFVDLFGERFPAWRDRTFRAIDLGCGPADVTVRFARSYPRAAIVGVDAADAMLAIGRARVHDERLTGRVRLELRHLPDATLAGAGFEAGLSNSLLHHLADPLVLWNTLSGCTRPGAPILVMDLCRPDDDETVEAMVARHARGEPPVLVHDFRASLRAAYRVDEVEAQLAAAQLELTVDRVTDRHLVVWGTR